MGAENKASPILNDVIDSAMNTEIVEPNNSLPNIYIERYNYFTANFIQHDAPVPHEHKKEFQLLQLLFQTENQSFTERINEHKIDINEEIQPPQIAWSLKNQHSEEFEILGTLGNFSLITGKAKSRKTFFMNIAISAALQKELVLNRFSGTLPPDQNEVLYFDTEQGKYHVQKAVKRVCELTGIKEPKNLHTYFFRSFSPKERLEAIEHLIYNTPKIGFVVIDGIKDLITSINDESEASMITTKLLKWSEERNIHIVTVLHQNKSDNNARGHIGTELINKAETVLSIEKSENDESISIVIPKQTRNKEPEIFAFEIIDNIPAVAENFELRTETKKNKFDVTHIEEYKKYKLLTEVFSKGDSFNYNELRIQLQFAFKSQLGEKLADNRAKILITDCKNKNWLLQEKAKAPYTLGAYVRPEMRDVF
jgi:hypothetical protein